MENNSFGGKSAMPLTKGGSKQTKGKREGEVKKDRSNLIKEYETEWTEKVNKFERGVPLVGGRYNHNKRRGRKGYEGRLP